MIVPVAIMLCGVVLLGGILLLPDQLRLGRGKKSTRTAALILACGLIIIGGALGYLRYNISVADRHYASGQYEEGLALYQRLAGLDGGNVAFLNGIAFGKYQTGDYSGAYEAAEASLAQRPDDNYDATMIKSWVESAQGHKAAAVETLKSIATADTVGSYVYYEIAILEWDQGSTEAAVEACARAIDYNPSYLAAYESLAGFYAEQSRFEEQAGVYAMLLDGGLTIPGRSEEESRAVFSYNRGAALYYAGLYQEAADSFRDAATLNVTADTLYYLASCYALNGDSMEAVETLDSMLEMEPTFISHVVDDIDFNSLYEMPEYQSLVEKYTP